MTQSSFGFEKQTGNSTVRSYPLGSRHSSGSAAQRRPGRLQRAVSAAIGASLLLGSQWASAGGPPIPFDNYTVNNGTVSATCPTTSDGVTAICTDETSDNGLLQRRVVVPSGVHKGTYLQFILTDSGVSGDAQASPFSAARGSLNFSNEDFIQLNHRGDGIASKQTIIDSNFATATKEDRFVNDQTYLFGWAQTGIDPWVFTTQSISQLDYSLDPLNPTLLFDSSAEITNNGGPVTGPTPTGQAKTVLSQYVDLTDLSGTGSQQFNYAQATGQYNPTAGSATLPGGSGTGSISWNANEDVSALWIGQSINALSLGDFGLTRFNNNTTGTMTRKVDLALGSLPTSPSVWPIPPFAPLPVLNPSPVTTTPTATVAAPSALTPSFASPSSTTVVTGAAPVSLPVQYNQWTVSNGVFSVAPCPSGATCSPPIVNEGGVFQRNVTVAGVTYIQTIVTDPTATGDGAAPEFTPGALAFKSETFVKASSAGGTGIASNLQIAEEDLSYLNAPTNTPLPTTGGQFGYSTQIKTGWAHAAGSSDPLLVVNQRVTVPDRNGQQTTSMDDRFHMELGEQAGDIKVDIAAVVGTNAVADTVSSLPASLVPESNCIASGGTPVYSGTTYVSCTTTIPGNGYGNPIMFNSSLVAGSFQQTSHALTDPFLLPSNSGNIAWNTGDAIQATWVGGSYLTSTPFSPSVVGATSYTNQSTGARTAYADVKVPVINPLASPNPDSWVAPFTPPSLSYQSSGYVPPPTPGP